jgi:Ras homolog enriched in brain
VVRYVDDAFVDSYYPTIENIFNKKIKYRNSDFECDIIDTAGQVRFPFSFLCFDSSDIPLLLCDDEQDEYSILNSKHAIGIHGYVLVYSIASRNSFEMVQTVYDKILNYTGTESVPCVVVGQKSDLHVQR